MNKPIATINAQMKGMFKIEATNVTTGVKRVVADWFDNLITDQGLDYPGGGGSYAGGNTPYVLFCHLGSGNTPPAVTDIGLDAVVGSVNGGNLQNSTSETSEPWFWTQTRVYRFAAGVATGTLAEIGVGHSNDNVSLFSRALILDGIGNPTTINIDANEILDVTYKLLSYPDAAMLDINTPVAGSFDIDVDGVAVTHTTQQIVGWVTAGIRSVGIEIVPSSFIGGTGLKSNAFLTPITDQNIGGDIVTATNDNVMLPYVDGTYTRDFTTTWDLDEGNHVDGITGINIQSGIGTFQVLVDPPIAKDDTKRMSLTFRMSWSRKP